MVYSMDQRTIQQDIKAATDDAINELNRLIDKHDLLSGKRPRLDKEDTE